MIDYIQNKNEYPYLGMDEGQELSVSFAFTISTPLGPSTIQNCCGEDDKYKYYLCNQISPIGINRAPSWIIKTLVTVEGNEITVAQRRRTTPQSWNTEIHVHKIFEKSTNWKYVQITQETANNICKKWWKVAHK